MMSVHAHTASIGTVKGRIRAGSVVRRVGPSALCGNAGSGCCAEAGPARRQVVVRERMSRMLRSEEPSSLERRFARAGKGQEEDEKHREDGVFACVRVRVIVI